MHIHGLTWGFSFFNGHPRRNLNHCCTFIEVEWSLQLFLHFIPFVDDPQSKNTHKSSAVALMMFRRMQWVFSKWLFSYICPRKRFLAKCVPLYSKVKRQFSIKKKKKKAGVLKPHIYFKVYSNNLALLDLALTLPSAQLNKLRKWELILSTATQTGLVLCAEVFFFFVDVSVLEISPATNFTVNSLHWNFFLVKNSPHECSE